MKRTGLVLVAALTVAGGACSSSDPTGVAESLTAGRWSWVESFGGIAGMRVTPASEGVEREIRFRSGATAELWVDGERVRTTGYETGVGRPDGSFAGREVVRWDVPLLGGWEEQGIAFPHPDTLVLADGCCDGYVWTFARTGS